MAEARWTNPSVRAFAHGADPVAVITERARAVAYEARERGWAGPPFDPFELADQLGIDVVAVDELDDARLVFVKGKPRIDFNPNRPRTRVRFSVAHELAHWLFPDAADEIRYRAHSRDQRRDDWQVELLCNLGAAEFLMPVGSFPELAGDALEINKLMRIRQEYGVSTEALLLRMARVTPEAAAVFAAARIEPAEPEFRIDYVVGTRAWSPSIVRGLRVRARPLAECTAVGHTAKGSAEWGTQLHVECVGVPPYPGHRYPRVVGLLLPAERRPAGVGISYVDGDATQPRGQAPRIIAHVVNDKTSNWGGRGFAVALRQRWPQAQEQFGSWAGGKPTLGSSHLAELADGIYAFSMVAQHGYGPTPQMRLRYGALEHGLSELGRIAADLGASVHMPLIGTGYAGGDWGTVKELIYAEICGRGIEVTVYVVPGAPLPEEAESQLALGI